MLTRAALGAYQKANGLKVDCWPTAEVLTHMQGRRKPWIEGVAAPLKTQTGGACASAGLFLVGP